MKKNYCILKSGGSIFFIKKKKKNLHLPQRWTSEECYLPDNLSLDAFSSSVATRRRAEKKPAR